MSVTVSHCQEKFLQVLELSVQVIISYPALVRAADLMRMVRLKFGTKIFLQTRDLLWHIGGMQCICKKSVVFVFQRRKGKKLLRQIKSILTKNTWLLMLWGHECQSLWLLMRNINKMSFLCSSEEKIKLLSQFLTY